MTNFTIENEAASDDAAARSARTYYVGVLVVWSSLSVAGNALHALESGAGSLAPLLSAVIATIPPIALIAITHLLILQLRTSKGSWKRLATPLALMLSSFALSFTALRELAVMAGFPPLLAPLMAVIIDGPVVQASAALYYDALERRKTAYSAVPQHFPSTPPESGKQSDVTADIPVVVQTEPRTTDVDGACDDEAFAGQEPVLLITEEADQLVRGDSAAVQWPSENEPVVTGPGVPQRQVQPDEIALGRLVRQKTNARASELIVARALMYVDQGYSQEQAAEVAGVHRTTVARWAAARDEILEQQGLVGIDM